MNTITIIDKNYTSPSKWNEMQAWHLIIWVKILAKNIERTDAFSLATILFYKINKALYFKLEPAHHVQLKDTISFLAERNELTTWLIKFVKPLPWLKYVGPSNKLATSTIQEFRLAENFYMFYQKTKNEDFLDLLIATLYRKKGESNLKADYRMQLSELLIDQHGKQMRRLSKPVRAAILFNYEGCRNYVFAKYPTIFKVGKSDDKQKKMPDLENLITTVAGGKFGVYKDTKDTSLYLFLDHLAEEIEHTEQLKRK